MTSIGAILTCGKIFVSDQIKWLIRFSNIERAVKVVERCFIKRFENLQGGALYSRLDIPRLKFCYKSGV